MHQPANGIISRVVDYYTKTVEQAFEELKSSPEGLAATEVQERLRQYGPNRIVVKGEPLWRIILEPFVDIFMLVLFVAVAVSLLHHEYVDAIIIGAIMGINAAIYYVQRFSTERILRALQKKDPHIVDVIRDGVAVQLDATLLVPGDVIVLSEGEKIPADCRIVKQSSLRVDEAQLTGESLPISKQAEPVGGNSELYERTNMVYQGSFVIGGQARALVVATGNGTEFGRLAALSVGNPEESPVQQRINKLISLLVRIIAGIALVAFVLSLYRGMEFTEAIRYVLALSVSAVPESLPVAITVVLVLGMRRMAKKKALVKSPAAIETIGIVTTIASDKTGTLTKNMLTVQQLWNDDLPVQDCLRAVMNSTLPAKSKTRDPLDVAMQMYTAKHKGAGRHGHIVASLPFDQDYAMSGNCVEHNGERMLWVKGAPEQILERCYMAKRVRDEAHDTVKSMAANGLRVLAMAKAPLKGSVKNFAQAEGLHFEFAGLIGVADVLRPEAPAAIKRAQAAGIRVCMVTGDHFETAFHIGRQLGIVQSSDQVFDSRKMHELTDDQLAEVVENTRVFARVVPEDKHRLLMVLKRTQITAMTGDGVNDVPALTGAHVGVAMGSGTSIAKDAGDIILLDNNFRSIVQAVHEGRTIYANIKRMVAYLLATNAGEVLVAVGSLIAGIPVPLTAVQILWVNLATDSFMVIPLGLEPGEKRNMLRPPQKANAPLFSKFMLSRIVITALTMGALTLGLYTAFIASHGVDYARVIAFNALVVMQWASAFNSRSDYETLFTRIRRFNGPFYIGLGLAVLSQAIAMSGFMHEALGLTSAVTMQDIMWTSVLSFFVPIVIIELHKWIGRAFFGKGSKNVR